jgi:hypothetical protein
MRTPSHAMNTHKILAAAALILLSSLLVGCVYSIHPLYQEGKTVLEPAIVGAWTGEDSDGDKFAVTFAEINHTFYKATMTRPPDSNRSYVYDVYLLRLGDQLFADFVLEGVMRRGETKLIDETVGLVPLHMFIKFTAQKDTITFAILSQEWLKDQFAAHKLSVPHEDLDSDDIILTAAPPELQTFLQKISANPDAFDKPVVLQRKK